MIFRVACAVATGTLLASAGSALSQTAPMNEPPPSPAAQGLMPGLLSQGELVVSIAILIFGMAVLAFQYFQQRHSSDHTADSVMKTTVVTLIIICTMLMITLGLSSQQIAPALGLFGTIAGYLLGKRDAEPRRDKEGAK